MRRIASALGLGRDRRKLHSESTPALVHHADSSSSSGIRTPSDVDQDMLGVPAIHSGSSTDSVAHSVRSTRWLPASLLRSLSRKRPVSIPDPIVAVAEPAEDDASSDSLSTRSSRPRSPPALLPPPLPFATGRRSSSPASSIYRAGLANVQRRAPPSRANVALHAFTQPLVLAGVSPTPHPLRAPDPSSPLAFPRSVSRPHLAPSHSLRIQLHRARVLRRLEEGSLTAAEETSILPFATRSPRSPPLARRRPSPTEPEDAVADLGTRTGRWSRGLRRWVARSVFEDRMHVLLPTGSDIVRPARDLGTETLDFSDGTLALAGLAIDSETDDDEDYARSPVSLTTPPLGSPMDIKLAANGTAPERPSAGAKPSGSKTKAPVVRGVRFADDDDATDGDDLPLAVLASVQKKRAEKEARARHDRQVGAQDGRRNSVDAKARVFADQVARARVLRDSARAGVERPASFVREAEVRRKTLAPATGLSTLREDGSSHVREGRGHARTGSWGSTNDRRRNTVGEGSDPVPVRAGFSPSSSAFLAPSSPLANSAGLPSSAPSALASFPPNMSAPFMHSNSFPRAAHSPVRNQTTSPLRSSFALNTDEFGQPNLEAIMAQNQALLAQNQFLLQALQAPNPPFAHSQGGSSASSRRSGSSRPGPTPMQRSSVAMSGSQSPKVGSQPMKPSTSGQSQRTTGSSKPTPTSSTPISHAHSKSVSQSHSKSKSQPNTRHAHSKSESQRMSRLMAAPAPPMPSVPTGVYSMRGRARTGAEVIT